MQLQLKVPWLMVFSRKSFMEAFLTLPEIVRAGAFVFGGSSALMASIEGSGATKC